VLDDGVSHGTTNLVHGLGLQGILLDFIRFNRVDGVPACVEDLLITQSVENTVAAKHDKIVEVLADGELRDLRLGDNHSFFASVFGMLCLDVAKGSRDREPARDHSVWAKNVVLLRLILARHLNLLNRLCLIDATSILDDTLHFILFIWTVIPRQKEKFLAFVGAHYSTTVSNVGYVALLADDEDDDAAAATAFMHRLLAIGQLDEAPFGLETASRQSLGWVLRETWLVDND